jgi:hypothetical protein
MHARSNRRLVRLALDIDLVARVRRKTSRPPAQHSTLQANYFIAS